MTTDRTPAQSLLRVLLLTAFVLAVPLVANQFIEGEGWSVFDFVLVGVLVGGTGLLYELAARRPASRTSAVVSAGMAAVGGAAIVIGEVDDAPGLMLIGLALIVTAVVVGIRGVRRVSESGGEGPGAAGSA